MCSNIKLYSTMVEYHVFTLDTPNTGKHIVVGLETAEMICAPVKCNIEFQLFNPAG